MRSKAQIAGHPLHPMLVTVPAGGFVIALVLDVVHLATDAPMWWQATIPVLTISIVGALVAAVPGVVDLLAVAIRQGALRQGAAHAVLNLVLVGVSIGNLFLRLDQPAAPANAGLPFWLSVAGVAILSVSGFLGWVMVQTYHVGAWEHPEARDPLPHALPPQRDQLPPDLLPPGEPVLP